MAALCSGEAERQIARIELYGKLAVAERKEACAMGERTRMLLCRSMGHNFMKIWDFSLEFFRR
ncbi:MAG: hypothetical protein IKH03_04580 [Oscillospiraceae bacterium]|nr:hypothetical protein [Oscillospiraceae bacterium]